MKNKIESILYEVPAKFHSRFGSVGFSNFQAANLIPTDDDSLLFTNSTIVRFKKFLQEGSSIDYPGGLINQPCLRFHNLKLAGARDQKTQYLSYFHQFGVFAAPESLGILMDAISMYFFDDLELDPQKIVFKTHPDLAFFNNSTLSRQERTRIISGNQPDSYFRWTYGIENVSGKGITFAIETNEGIQLDCGNIIEIRRGNKICAYEFGFGLETFVSRILSCRNPIACAPITLVTPELDDQKFDLLKDFLQAGLVMVSLGLEAGKGRRRGLLRKILVSLAKEASILGLSSTDILRISNLYIISTGMGKNVLDAFERMYHRRLHYLEELQ